MIVARFILNWRGPQVLAKMEKACITGINHTMTDCVGGAKDLVRRDTNRLYNSIMQEPAKLQAGAIVGQWGSFTCPYAIYQEIGPVTGKRNWGFTPYLRPSAQTHYPELEKNIREAFV